MQRAHAAAIKRRNHDESTLVKSAGRILEVLEYACDATEGLTATEITREFGYPLSSTYALLRTMTTRGYLAFDKHRRTYHPTARLSLIGARTPQPLPGEAVLRIMREINQQSGELVVLAMRNDMHVHLIYTLEGRYAVPPHPRDKEMRALTSTTSGKLFLSTLKDDHIRALIRRKNAEAGSGSERVNVETFLHDVQQIRRQGYSMNVSQDLPGVGGVGVLIPQTGPHDQLAILIANYTENIVTKPDYYAQIIRNALAHYSQDDVVGSG